MLSGHPLGPRRHRASDDGISRDAGRAAGPWMWDGRDAIGRPLASGVYFVEGATREGTVVRGRVTIVR